MTEVTGHLEAYVEPSPTQRPWRRRLAKLILFAVSLWAAGAVAAVVAFDDDRPVGSDEQLAASYVPGTPLMADRDFARLAGTELRFSVRLAALVAERTSDPEIRNIANQIRERHAENLGPIQRWLLSWQGARRPALASSAPRDRADLDAMLSARNGPAFNRLFLSTMIAQHRTLLAAADDQIEGGGFEPARQLATALVLDATTELAQIRRLLQEAERA